MEKWYQNALLINRDPDWCLRGALDGATKEEMEESIHRYFRQFTGHKITDFLLCVFTQSSFIPSEVITWIGEKHLLGEAMKDDPYYRAFERLWTCFRTFGLDPVLIFLDEMQQAGIRPWITLRMNDTHKIPGIKSSLYHEELAAGHMLGEEYGYYHDCFDYSYPKIREAMLAYIREVLSKYDFFGLELDFMREIFCFDYKHNPNCHRIMTDFIRQVKALVLDAEQRVGHPIRLMIRTSRSPKDALEFGFDIKTYCEEKLIDAVNPTPRWEVLDSAIPVREWRELVGDDIAIFPGIEILSLKQTTQTAEQTKAYAAAWFAQGGDGIYFNNHQDGTDTDLRVWNIRQEECLQGKRRLIVTYQDIASGSYPAYRPLPMDTSGSIVLEAGPIKATDKLTVTIDFEGAAAPTLTIGNLTNLPAQVCAPLIVPKLPYFGGEVNMTEHQPLCYDCSGLETDCQLTLSFAGEGTIHYLELVIEPA